MPQGTRLALRQTVMQRKIFWTIAAILNLFAGMWLPFVWSLAAAIPITVLAWWIAYRWLEL